MKKSIIVTLALVVSLCFASTAFAGTSDNKVGQPQTIKGVTIMKPMLTKDDIAKRNMETIVEFFSLYLKDKPKFYSLWVEDNPVVVTPFANQEIISVRKPVKVGWPAVKGFWDPIFDEWKGQFDWQIDEVIVGDDPNTIVTLSHSKIDVSTGPTFDYNHLKYTGTYVQIFKFENGKVKSFEEYYDTALLASQFKSK